jgi:hypothetical protein
MQYIIKSLFGNMSKSLSFVYLITRTKLQNTCPLVLFIDILYTLDSASNYSAIQKLKPWLQTQDIPMKWEDSYVFYFLNRELKH